MAERLHKLLAAIGITVLAIAGADASADAANGTAVALVCLVEGQAVVSATTSGDRALALLDRLEPGQTVSTGPLSHLVVTFFDGQRFALPEYTSATVGKSGLVAVKGQVRRLRLVVAAPSLSPIARSEAPGQATAAARLRVGPDQEEPVLLDPPRWSVVLADHCLLRFSPQEGVQRYQVTIEDSSNSQVYQVESQDGEVPVPAGILQPGANYYWEVCPLLEVQASECMGAMFATLPVALANQRARLTGQLAGSNEPDLLILAAELDRCLGLSREACESLAAACRLAAHPVPITEAMERLGCDPSVAMATKPSSTISSRMQRPDLDDTAD